MFDVVTAGVACADVMVRPVDALPPRGKVTLVPNLELHMGGLAAVTAAIVSQLGGTSAFIGAVGLDGFGEFILGTLGRCGVDASRVKRVETAGTSATAVLIGSDGERTFLHHFGSNAELGEEDVDLEFCRRAKVFHWGGPSITPRLDGAPMGRVLERVRALGVKTSMDTCYDGTGKWFAHIEHALPHLDIVMSSIEEARMYTGKQSPEEIAEFFLNAGVETVMVKLGADGMYLRNRQESERLPAHPVPVVDTTGAGDAACGGFLYGYVRGWSLHECGRLANAVGALTVQTMGGANAVESLAQVKAFMEGDR